MRRSNVLLAACLLSATVTLADVSVMFTNNLEKASGEPFAENTPGTITLGFTVDAGGNVTLDASCSETNATIVDAVDDFDGPVGTVSYTGAFSSSFSIVVDGVGGKHTLERTGQPGWFGHDGYKPVAY